MHASEATARDVGTTADRPALSLESGDSVLVFTWTGDRWAHRVFARATGRSAGLQSSAAGGWQSVEGVVAPAGDPRWPASPVLVELSRVELPRAVGKRTSALVGVGLAGRSHYSASVAADPERPDAFRVEIACRLQEPPVWVGSTYRCGTRQVRLAVVDAAASLPATILWSYSIGPAGIMAPRGAILVEAAACETLPPESS